jgi:tRNA-specific 2-thiouridylase
MSRVLVAMSGGVDSSVAALLCLREGHEVIGATMQVWPEAPEDVAREHGGCCSLDAVTDARRVCAGLGIPHYVYNLRQEFQEAVIDYFCDAYAVGRTPNPCIVCNQTVKFTYLLDRAKKLEADYLATGHYARVICSPSGRYLLKRASWPEKDQSYALYSLTQEQLRYAMFPVGELPKSEVRRIAQRAGLPTSNKPESQDICFVVGGDHTGFVRERHPAAFVSGPIKDSSGRVVGRHEGIGHFTIGQRRGLGLSGGGPFYVLDIRPNENSVIVGPWEESLAHGLVAAGCNWIAFDHPRGPFRAQVKIRYRATSVPCTVEPLESGSVTAIFDSPECAVTPGQAAVFYDGDIVIGGGAIERRIT